MFTLLLSWDHNRGGPSGAHAPGTACRSHSGYFYARCSMLFTPPSPPTHWPRARLKFAQLPILWWQWITHASITNIFYGEGPCFQCERWKKLFGLCLKWRSWNLFKAAGYIPPTLCEIKSPWSDHFKGVTPDITALSATNVIWCKRKTTKFLKSDQTNKDRKCLLHRMVLCNETS